MQEPPGLVVPSEEPPQLKLRKKNPLNQATPAIQKKGETNRMREPVPPLARAKKGSKKNSVADISTAVPMADPLLPSGDYRALRHKYLLLEEESFSLDRALSKVSGEVQGLEDIEDEKSLLLDQLVVLEGLIDPRELKRSTVCRSQ